MDRVARELKLDPAEVRRRNFIRPEQMPYKVGIIFRDGRPVTYDSGDYPACQATALEAADYAGFAARQREARARGRYIGIGISNAVEATGLGPYEGATVRVSTTGKIALFTGATPHGQSHKTMLAQIAADQLGADYEDITVVTGDTVDHRVRHGHVRCAHRGQCGLIGASRGDRSGEEAEAARRRHDAGEARRHRVARRLRLSPRRSRRSAEHFRELAFKAAGMPGVSMAGGLTPGIEHTAYFTPDQSTYSNGTHVAEVEVDIETGDGEDPALHRDARLRQRHQSDGGEGPGRGRRRARRRQRAVRAHDLRRQRAAAERQFRRISAARFDRRAARRAASHGNAVAAESDRRQRRGRRRHDPRDRRDHRRGRERARRRST